MLPLTILGIEQIFINLEISVNYFQRGFWENGGSLPHENWLKLLLQAVSEVCLPPWNRPFDLSVLMFFPAVL